jgi:hypothetical protein
VGKGGDSPTETHGTKDTKEKTEVLATSPSPAASTASVAPAEVSSAATAAGPLVVWPEIPKQSPEDTLAATKQAANARFGEWLVMEPQVARQALAATLAVLTAAPEAEERPLGLADRSAALRGGGSTNGGDGSSSTEGHSSAPTPGPGPGGSGGGSAAGGGSPSGSSAATTLVAVFFNVPVAVMRRLGVAARSPRKTFFVLIPEKPD